MKDIGVIKMTNTDDWNDEDREELDDYLSQDDNTCDPEDYGFSKN